MSSILFTKIYDYEYYIENDDLYMLDTRTNIKVRALPDGIKVKEYNEVGKKSYSCFLLGSDNKLYTWGVNEHGQLGRNTNVTSMFGTYDFYPQAVKLPDGVFINSLCDILFTYSAFYVLASDGLVYSWGNNDYGKLARNYDNCDIVYDALCIPYGYYNCQTTAEPIIFPDGVYIKSITDIRVSTFNAFALASDGNLYAWGDNRFGNLTRPSSECDIISFNETIAGDIDEGVKTIDEIRKLACSVPKAIQFPNNAKIESIDNIKLLSSAIFALADDGLLYAWGRNNHGQLARDKNGRELFYFDNDEADDKAIEYSSIPMAITFPNDDKLQSINDLLIYFSRIFAIIGDVTYTWGYSNHIEPVVTTETIER